MFFKLKSNVIFRNYVSFGYITDNRNFGYRQTSHHENFIGDKILSESGAVFLSALEKLPLSIEDIAKKINVKFEDVDYSIIKNDAIEFFYMLENDGFVVSGNTMQDCFDKDTKFSYKTIEPEMVEGIQSMTELHMQKSTQDFFDEFNNGKPHLTNLHIEITSKCNERCLHCYIPHDYKESSIKPELFYNILEQSKNMNLLHLTISGGEPMLHKDFCNFLKKCKEYDFSVNVLSNLTALNAEILAEMRAYPLLGVQVSLYSMKPEIHDEITQSIGSFEKTKIGILKLVENDIPLQISCPILQQNKNSYPEVIQWAKKLKINVGDDFGIIARYNHTTQNLKFRLSLDEIYELIKKKKKTDPKYFEQLEKTAEKKRNISPSDYICSVCSSSICITECGNVYPCAGWQDYLIGNLKTTSLKDIWENSDRVNYLRGLRNQDFPKCVNCPDKEFCTMCMVRNANEDPLGNPFTVNEYFCRIAKINRQIASEWREKLNHLQHQ